MLLQSVSLNRIGNDRSRKFNVINSVKSNQCFNRVLPGYFLSLLYLWSFSGHFEISRSKCINTSIVNSVLAMRNESGIQKRIQNCITIYVLMEYKFKQYMNTIEPQLCHWKVWKRKPVSLCWNMHVKRVGPKMVSVETAQWLRANKLSSKKSMRNIKHRTHLHGSDKITAVPKSAAGGFSSAMRCIEPTVLILFQYYLFTFCPFCNTYSKFLYYFTSLCSMSFLEPAPFPSQHEVCGFMQCSAPRCSCEESAGYWLIAGRCVIGIIKRTFVL